MYFFYELEMLVAICGFLQFSCFLKPEKEFTKDTFSDKTLTSCSIIYNICHLLSCEIRINNERLYLF